MTIKFSRWLAILGGILVPLAETIRRWSTWQQSPASLFDEYILGAFLLLSAQLNFALVSDYSCTSR